MWDTFRIEQVIVNLLTNAIRYGQKKPIKVSLINTAGGARVYVKDQGAEISPEDQTRLFEPFKRGASNNVSAGLRLGLYISRQLVEAHNGTINVQRNPGSNTVFTVPLPLSPEHHQATEA